MHDADDTMGTRLACHSHAHLCTALTSNQLCSFDTVKFTQHSAANLHASGPWWLLPPLLFSGFLHFVSPPRLEAGTQGVSNLETSSQPPGTSAPSPCCW